jgi:hypothetical protein
MHTKKAGRKTQCGGTLQKQAPLLTHCTNPRPLNCIGLDNSPRNSGVNVGILDGAEVAQAEIAGM